MFMNIDSGFWLGMGCIAFVVVTMITVFGNMSKIRKNKNSND